MSAERALPRHGDDTAFVAMAHDDARLVLRLCEEFGKFDAEVYLEELDGGSPDKLPGLLRAAEWLGRTGRLRQIHGSWYRVGDVMGEALPAPVAITASPDVELVDRESMVIAVVGKAGEITICARWNPDALAARVMQEADPSSAGALSWRRAALDAIESIQRDRCVTLDDVRVVLEGWANYHVPVLGDEGGFYLTILEHLAPGWMLTPTLFIRREISEGGKELTRLDRYRRYSLALTASIREGQQIPLPVLRAVLREFLMSWIAFRYPAGIVSETDLAIEMCVAQSLLEVLHGARLMPDAIPALMVATDLPGSADIYVDAYRHALDQFNMLDDFEIASKSTHVEVSVEDSLAVRRLLDDSRRAWE